MNILKFSKICIKVLLEILISNWNHFYLEFSPIFQFEKIAFRPFLLKISFDWSKKVNV